MKAAFIGAETAEIKAEGSMIGPFTRALWSYIAQLIDELDITYGITGATPGSETVFCRACLEKDIDLHIISHCRGFANELSTFKKDTYMFIISRATKFNVVETPDDTDSDIPPREMSAISLNSAVYRDAKAIDKADVVMVVVEVNRPNYRITCAIEHAKKKGKEIILIKTNELDYETIPIQTH